MADVKWIKITTDIFDNEKMLLIESLPEADSIIVIWFKLLCLAGKMNNSGVFMMNNRVPYNYKMLATIFRRKERTVQLALQTFESFGMIEMIDDVITIPNWSKHQNLEQLEERKQYMRNYMQERRQKQKELANNNEVNSKVNSKVDSKVNNEVNSKVNSKVDSKVNNEVNNEVNSKVNSKVDSKVNVSTPEKNKIRIRLDKSESVEEYIESHTHARETTYESLVSQYGKAFVDERIARAKKYAGATIETVAKWCEEDANKRNDSNRFSNCRQYRAAIDEASLISNNGGIILPD